MGNHSVPIKEDCIFLISSPTLGPSIAVRLPYKLVGTAKITGFRRKQMYVTMINLLPPL